MEIIENVIKSRDTIITNLRDKVGDLKNDLFHMEEKIDNLNRIIKEKDLIIEKMKDEQSNCLPTLHSPLTFSYSQV